MKTILKHNKATVKVEKLSSGKNNIVNEPLQFMDQAGWHKAKDLKVPANMSLVWLPAYSPQCNPAEHIWEEIREKWFNNKVFDSLDAVEDTLVDALISLEKDKKKL